MKKKKLKYCVRGWMDHFSIHISFYSKASNFENLTLEKNLKKLIKKESKSKRRKKDIFLFIHFFFPSQNFNSFTFFNNIDIHFYHCE